MKRCAPESLNDNDRFYAVNSLSDAQRQALKAIGMYGDGELYYPKTLNRLVKLGLIKHVEKKEYELTQYGEIAYSQLLAKEVASWTGQI